MDKQVTARLHVFAPSRRHFLRASAIASGIAATTAIAPGPLAGIALAEAAAQAGGDLGILNFALTLELLELSVYRKVLASGLLTGQALAFGRKFSSNEAQHVDLLTKTIRQLGGTPAKLPATTKLPSFSTQAKAIDTLRTFEDVGASAYLGAAPLVKNPDILTVAVRFHTVEAEHATGWRFLLGEDPLPFAFAPPRTAAQVLAIVNPYLKGTI